MVKETTILMLDMLLQEGFQLIDIYHEQCGCERTPLCHMYGAFDKIRQSMHCVEAAKNKLGDTILVSRISEMPMSSSLWNMVPLEIESNASRKSMKQ
jgi:hypothetical protein